MLMISEPTSSTHTTMVIGLIVYMVILMTMVLVVEPLRHVHLKVLMSSTTVKQAMVLPMVAMTVHAVRVVRRRIRARRSVGRGCIGVVLKYSPATPYRRAVSVVRVPGVVIMLVRIEELAAGIEPVESIGHYQPAFGDAKRLSQRCRVCAVEECSFAISGRGRCGYALSSVSVHRHSPGSS